MLGLNDILDRFHRQKTRTVQLCQAHQGCVSREHKVFYVISTFLNIYVDCTITFYIVDGLRFTLQALVTNMGMWDSESWKRDYRIIAGKRSRQDE